MENKYISPGGWFSLNYPVGWMEFEDTEDTFLFYNPNQWSGNFRISAYRDADKDYAKQCLEWELKNNPTSVCVKVGEWDCAYSSETFQDSGAWYTTHLWVTGKGDLSFECSFTVEKGGERTPAESIIRSLTIRKCNEPIEFIPIRVSEVSSINVAFDWVSTQVKKTQSKDFTAQEDDIVKLQKLIDNGNLKADQRQVWENIGIVLGVIIENEIDGMEWMTVIDKRQEYPALRYQNTQMLVAPANLIWDKVKSKQPCDLMAEFTRVKEQVEALL